MMKYVSRWLLVSLCVFGWAASSAAQRSPLTYRVTLGGAGSSGQNLPFWLEANQSGLFNPTEGAGFVRLSSETGYQFGERLRVRLGGEVVGRASDQTTAYFNQLFAKIQWGAFQLRIGREVETVGTSFAELSGGSLATSTNATPLPKIHFSVPAYTKVPFTRGFATFKGVFAHGWFEANRDVKSPFLHEKSFYLRLGGAYPIKVYGGMVNYAMWGGESERFGNLPEGFDDFLRTIWGSAGASDAPGADQIYVQGNHLGIYDLGVTASYRGYEAVAYRQFIFDDKDGLYLKNPQDGILGLSIQQAAGTGIVSHLVYEYLHTKWQSGPERVGSGRDGAGGWDDYYNHIIYRSGWTYGRRTIGSPFLFPYANPADALSGREVENTRVIGHHLGLRGNLPAGIGYRVLFSFTRNYGTYFEEAAYELETGSYRYSTGLEQTSWLVEATTPLPWEGWSLRTAVAWDGGEVYERRFGGLVALSYQGTK